MERVNADIWVLTETHDDLRPTAPGSWSSISSDNRPQVTRDVKVGSRWVTIWTRLPIKRVRPSYDPVRTAAGIVNTPIGNLLVFGTVLPWYQDSDRSVAREIVEQSEDWGRMLDTRNNLSLCVAGDLNVNLGGPHYYGANEGKDAVCRTFRECDLLTLTNFKKTGPAQYGEFGLIDHIAISESFAELVGVPDIWQRENYRGEVMSDHCGVSVELSSSDARPSTGADKGK